MCRINQTSAEFKKKKKRLDKSTQQRDSLYRRLGSVLNSFADLNTYGSTDTTI